MTTPSDPFGPPDPSQQQPGGPPPGYGQQPAWGQPAGQPEGYGAPGGFGAPPPGWGQPQKSGTNGLAIASLVTAFLCAPAGIVCGIIAKNQIKQTGQAGNGLATAGIIISIVGIVLNVLLLAGGAFSAAP